MTTFIRAKDLSQDDLLTLYGLMLDEILLPVFFHDNKNHITLQFFCDYVLKPEHWFYALKQQGCFAGFIVINNFSSSGKCAFFHGCSFKACRGVYVKKAICDFLEFFSKHSKLESLVALVPRPYRAVRDMAIACGFLQLARLPKAMRIYRHNKAKDVDGFLYNLNFNKKKEV